MFRFKPVEEVVVPLTAVKRSAKRLQAFCGTLGPNERRPGLLGLDLFLVPGVVPLFHHAVSS